MEAFQTIATQPRHLPRATGLSGSPFSTRNVYNQFGYLKEVRLWLDSDSGLPTSQLQGQVYWMADSYDVSGRVDGETYGNGLANDRVYSDATGRLTRATIDRGANLSGPFLVQDLNYTYDNVGNVVRRHDLTPGFMRELPPALQAQV